MINLGSPTFECDTLFYQPTYKCGKNCSECYVKTGARTLGSLEGMSSELTDNFLGEVISRRNLIKTNQFTMSIDCLPTNQYFVDNLKAARELLDPFRSFVGYLKNEKSQNIEVHATVHSFDQLERTLYVSNTLYDTPEVIENLDMISISNCLKGSAWLTQIEKIRKLCPGAKLNLNVMAYEIMSLQPEMLDHVDMIYLLHAKPVLGSTFSEHLSDLETFHEALKRLDTFPHQEKIKVDHCIADALNKVSINCNTCSANVSNFTVWPTGRVTGCAYNSTQHFGKPANYLSDIVDNLKDVRNHYDFNNCTLPNSFIQLRSKKDNERVQ